MEDYGEEEVREVVCVCSAQSGKTVLLMALASRDICEDPGPSLWLTFNKIEARKLMKGRIEPFFDQCKPVAERRPQNRRLNTTLEIYFPGSPFIVGGANQKELLQSTPYRHLYLDEARSYPKGTLEQVSKRTRSYRYNYKKIVISTPDLEGDELHQEFLSGNQCHWECECPECGHYQELRWGNEDHPGGIKWDKNEKTIPAPGVYNYEELLPTVRYECEKCLHAFKDTDYDRKRLSRSGRWVAKNANAPKHIRSYTWSALLPYWASWQQSVHDHLQAKRLLTFGNWQPFKVFVNETLGQVWTDRMRHSAGEKFLNKRVRRYDPREFMPNIARTNSGTPYRIATIDVQGRGGRHFYVLIRDWSRGGVSRLVHWRVMWSVEEIHQYLAEWNVSPYHVAIDSGAWASEIYGYIVNGGRRWKAMKGEDKPFFPYKGRRYIFNQTMVDPALGSAQQGRSPMLPLILYSKPSCLDRLSSMMHGLNGDWQIYPEAADDNYEMQVTAYTLLERANNRGIMVQEWHLPSGRQDHLCSCEMMQIAAAAFNGLLAYAEEPGQEESQEILL